MVAPALGRESAHPARPRTAVGGDPVPEHGSLAVEPPVRWAGPLWLGHPFSVNELAQGRLPFTFCAVDLVRRRRIGTQWHAQDSLQSSATDFPGEFDAFLHDRMAK